LGLDKVSNNTCFICIKHIQLHALKCLSGADFAPCKTNSVWNLPSAILDQVSKELKKILFKSLPPYQTLFYLMATYKQHEAKYCWPTNAYRIVFSNIALLFTISSKLVLESFKGWAHFKVKSYKKIL
jgi:hypothetical protein